MRKMGVSFFLSIQMQIMSSWLTNNAYEREMNAMLVPFGS